jgi:hypothetical protein
MVRRGGNRFRDRLGNWAKKATQIAAQSSWKQAWATVYRNQFTSLGSPLSIMSGGRLWVWIT